MSTTLLEFDPKLAHHFGGGVYAKEMHIPAGNTIIQHRHNYDHLSVLASGEVLVLVDGVVSTYTSPACIVISAGKLHAIEAVKDSVWYCIHATDCTDIETVDQHLIQEV